MDTERGKCPPLCATVLAVFNDRGSQSCCRQGGGEEETFSSHGVNAKGRADAFCVAMVDEMDCVGRKKDSNLFYERAVYGWQIGATGRPELREGSS